MPKTLLPILFALCAFVVNLHATPADKLPPSSLVEIKTCAETILARQLPDGAINNLSSSQNILINPYFSAYCVLALQRSHILTRAPRHLDAARAALRWHAVHLNPDGTIHDYKGPPSDIRSTGDYDSADSYAALFVIALWNDYQTTRDTILLEELRPAFRRSLRVLDELRQTDALTYAKRTYKIKYFMDNLEVLHALRAAIQITKTIDPENQELIDNYNNWTRQLVAALANFYDPETQNYRYAPKHLDTARLYPGALANIFAILFLPTDTRQAAALYKSTCEKYSRQIAANNSPQIAAWFALAAQHTGNPESAQKLLAAADLQKKPRTHYHALKLLTLAHTPPF